MRKSKQPRYSSGVANVPSNQPACEDASDDGDASRAWLPEIVERIASSLSANEVACTLRLVSRATAQQLAERTTVRPAQPVPLWCFPAECRRVCRGLTLEKRQQLLCLTAASGDVANLKTAVAETGCPLTHAALEAAAGTGRLALCQWLVGPGRIMWEAHVAIMSAMAAAGSGHGDVVDWCLEPRSGAALRREDCLSRLVQMALRKGHEGLAWRMLDEWLPPDSLQRASYGWQPALREAAAGCSLAGLQRAWERFNGSGVPRSVWTDEQAVIASLYSPTTDWKEKCEFLLEKGCRLRADACCSIVCSKSVTGGGAVERLTWLRARGLALEHETLKTAAGKGDGALVAYLLAQGLRPTHNDDLLEACRGGCLEALQAMLATVGLHTSIDAVKVAARSGDLPILSWLVETSGAVTGGLTSELFRCAAASGNVELMAWLLARGCGWNREAWKAAAESGCEAALELLSKRRCPKPIDGEPYVVAARAGDVRTMAVLRRFGVPFDRRGGEELFAEVTSVLYYHTAAMSVLTWLRDHGCGVDWGAVEREVGKRPQSAHRDAVLAWMAEQQAPPPPRRAGLRPRRGK